MPSVAGRVRGPRHSRAGRPRPSDDAGRPSTANPGSSRRRMTRAGAPPGRPRRAAASVEALEDPGRDRRATWPIRGSQGPTTPKPRPSAAHALSTAIHRSAARSRPPWPAPAAPPRFAHRPASWWTNGSNRLFGNASVRGRPDARCRLRRQGDDEGPPSARGLSEQRRPASRAHGGLNVLRLDRQGARPRGIASRALTHRSEDHLIAWWTARRRARSAPPRGCRRRAMPRPSRRATIGPISQTT